MRPVRIRRHQTPPDSGYIISSFAFALCSWQSLLCSWKPRICEQCKGHFEQLSCSKIETYILCCFISGIKRHITLLFNTTPDPMQQATTHSSPPTMTSKFSPGPSCPQTSSSVCLVFFPCHCALQDGFGQT